MPLIKVDCIRVTHPCATLKALLLKLIPFNLHVLCLPLALILSQDQTLHCKMYCVCLSCSRIWISSKVWQGLLSQNFKELYIYSTSRLMFDISFLIPRFLSFDFFGVAKVISFFFSPKSFSLFSLPSPLIFSELFSPPNFRSLYISLRGCKSNGFFFFAKFYFDFFLKPSSLLKNSFFFPLFVSAEGVAKVNRFFILPNFILTFFQPLHL